MKETTRQEKGITLIALVLTIIVLIILAAVSVATLTGDNGILTKAQEARETTKKAEIDEQLRLAQLSAKIKKSGGDITIGEYLQELTEEKVDFVEGDTSQYGDLYDIYKKVIVVEGKYIYGLNEKNGDVVFEEKGTEDKIKPTVKSIEIVERTETTEKTTIKVKVSTVRNNGGTLKYYIKEENAVDYALVGEQEGKQEEVEYTFENLDKDTTYSKIKVEAIAPNGETAYLEIEISNVPSLAEEEAVTLSYRANGQAIGADTWTKGPVTVTVKVNINTKGYTLQTAQSTGVERTGELDWQETPSQIFTTKGTIYARLIDKTNGSKGKEYKKAIDKIDTTPPTINMEETQASVVATTNSITITATAEDEESGIEKYSFSKDNGASWEWKPTEGIVEGQTEASYTFSNLPTQTYNLKIKVTDKVGNEAVSDPITRDTVSVPGGKENIGMGGLTESAEIGIDYELADWTNRDVNVRLTNNSGNTNYYLQYQKCKPDMTDYNENRWENYEEGTFITFTENGVILARLTDNKTPGQTGNVGATVTGNVMKIDRLLPNVAPTATRTHNSITVTANATDPAARTEYACSGIDEEEGYRFKLGEGRWTAYQSSGEYTFDSNVSAGTNYTITVEAKDKAGNTKEGTVEIRTLATYTVTYDANGGTGAPSPDTKIEGTDLILNNSVEPIKSGGYKFLGWSTSSSSSSVEYESGDVYSKDEDVTLYVIYFKYGGFTNGYSATIGYDAPSLKWNTSILLPKRHKVELVVWSTNQPNTDPRQQLTAKVGEQVIEGREGSAYNYVEIPANKLNKQYYLEYGPFEEDCWLDFEYGCSQYDAQYGFVCNSVNIFRIINSGDGSLLHGTWGNFSIPFK